MGFPQVVIVLRSGGRNNFILSAESSQEREKRELLFIGAEERAESVVKTNTFQSTNAIASTALNASINAKSLPIHTGGCRTYAEENNDTICEKQGTE